MPVIKKGTGLASRLLGPIYTRYLQNKFSSSERYWEERYRNGGTSGRGSYGELAEYKAEVLNGFIARHGIQSVIEFGCGDGNQSKFFQCEKYHGFDVSPSAVEKCRNLFGNDANRKFDLVADYDGTQADLVLSLDVIYHLVEDPVFESYMRQLFSASRRFVFIYSSNTDNQPALKAPHVKHRRFTAWIDGNIRNWRLAEHIQNPHAPGADSEMGSIADFFLYEKQ